MNLKKNGLLVGMVGLLALVGALSSCATTPAGSLFDAQPSVILSAVNDSGSKTATLSQTVVLGVFGGDFPSVADTAKKGSITKVATVEYLKTPGVLGLWTKYTTVVTGE